MARLAQEVGTSESNLYNYFSSKTVLLSALAVDSLGVIARAFAQGQDNVETSLTAADAAPRLVALTRALASARFWIAAESTMPSETELTRRIFSQPDTIESDEVDRLLTVGLDVLTVSAQLLDEAVALDVLDPGNNVERSVFALASISGTLLAGRLDRWDSGLFNGRRMSIELSSYLFNNWGAPPRLLREASEILDDLADEMLAPRA